MARIIAICILSVIAVCAGLVLKFILGAQLRRWQRGQVFLDILEIAMTSRDGLVEATKRLTQCRDMALGFRLRSRLLRITEGEDPISALAVPTPVLPRRMLGMLEAGLAAGKLVEAIGWCRQTVRNDQRSRTASMENYAPLTTPTGAGWVLLPMPITLSIIMLFAIVFILPRLDRLYSAYDISYGDQLPTLWLSQLTMPHLLPILVGLILLTLLPTLILGRHLFEDIPLFHEWSRGGFLDVIDRLTPWRRWRQERDFSFVLAMLLDSGINEEKALRLAAGCTGSFRMQSAADRACIALQEGKPLPKALAASGASPELAGRWRSVLAEGRGCLRGLRGSLEYLEARSCQAEQATAQIVSTGLYLTWGALAAVFAIGVIRPLINATEFMVMHW